jgi:hypothetical protein
MIWTFRSRDCIRAQVPSTVWIVVQSFRSHLGVGPEIPINVERVLKNFSDYASRAFRLQYSFEHLNIKFMKYIVSLYFHPTGESLT